jgi:hypothetical protein
MMGSCRLNTSRILRFQRFRAVARRNTFRLTAILHRLARSDGSGLSDRAAAAPIAHRANRTVPGDRAPDRRLSNWQCRETKRPTAARTTGNRRRADRTVPDNQAADRRLIDRRLTNRRRVPR